MNKVDVSGKKQEYGSEAIMNQKRLSKSHFSRKINYKTFLTNQKTENEL